MTGTSMQPPPLRPPCERRPRRDDAFAEQSRHGEAVRAAGWLAGARPPVARKDLAHLTDRDGQGAGDASRYTSRLDQRVPLLRAAKLCCRLIYLVLTGSFRSLVQAAPKKKMKRREARTTLRRVLPRHRPNPFWDYASSPSYGYPRF
jgi:hypothetical protein